MRENSKTLAKRYSLALASSVDSKQLAVELRALHSLILKLSEYPKTQQIMFNRYINHEAKKAVLAKLAIQLKLSKELLGLLKLMVHYNRFHLLAELHQCLQQIADKNEGIMCVEVFAANENIKPSVQKELSAAMQKKFNKKIRLQIKIDKNIIGGLKLQTEGLLYDATVKNTLNKLRKEILS